MKTINNVILVLMLFISNAFYSQDGSLDVTFNSTGSAETNFGVNDSSVHSMVLQDNGKIIAAGTVFNHGDFSQFGLVRFNADGTLDTTFGDLGFAVSNVQGKITLNSVALQSNGKILAEGVIYNNYTDAQSVLTRFNSDGTLDTTFGDNGLVISDFVKINSMLVQADDKIVIAGFNFDSVNRDIILFRFNANGILDTTFGTNGIQTTDLAVRDFGFDIAFQSDGKIVLAGSSSNTNGDKFSDIIVLRYFADGNLDPSFGTSFPSGGVRIDIDDMDEGKSVEVQTDGKIVVSGWSFNSTSLTSTFKLIRLNPDGSMDLGFAVGGITTPPISTSEHQQLVSIQADGKILITGTLDVGTRKVFALARFLSNGTLDTTFGNNGVVTTSDGDETTSQANAIIRQPDGKIVAGGETGEASLSYHPQSVLRRYNNSGN